MLTPAPTFVAFDQWFAEMERAHTAFNAHRKERLAGSSSQSAFERLDDGDAAIIRRERLCMTRLRRREPETWAMEILRIAEPQLRTCAASVIWWDYFADRGGMVRWAHLDAYLCVRGADATDAELVAALYACGYTPWQAVRRVIVPDECKRARFRCKKAQ